MTAYRTNEYVAGQQPTKSLGERIKNRALAHALIRAREIAATAHRGATAAHGAMRSRTARRIQVGVGVVALMGVFAGASATGVGCSAALTQQGLNAAQQSALCVSSIILDVTGLATEDPAQIAAICGLAVQDVYNFVQAELAFAAASADAGTEDAAAAPVSSARGGVQPRASHLTVAQVDRLGRIRDNASKILATQK